MDKKIIKEYLRKDSDRFNSKTAGMNEFREIIQKQPIFIRHAELTFLPPIFHDFLKIYLKYPDHYIKVYCIEQYRLQYFENLLHKAEIIYNLFYREIFINMEKKTITLKWSKTRNLFAGTQGEPLWKPFSAALLDFYTNTS
jgi:hypothetical protein